MPAEQARSCLRVFWRLIAASLCPFACCWWLSQAQRDRGRAESPFISRISWLEGHRSEMPLQNRKAHACMQHKSSQPRPWPVAATFQPHVKDRKCPRNNPSIASSGRELDARLLFQDAPQLGARGCVVYHRWHAPLAFAHKVLARHVRQIWRRGQEQLPIRVLHLYAAAPPACMQRAHTAQKLSIMHNMHNSTSLLMIRMHKDVTGSTALILARNHGAVSCMLWPTRRELRRVASSQQHLSDNCPIHIKACRSPGA